MPSSDPLNYMPFGGKGNPALWRWTNRRSRRARRSIMFQQEGPDAFTGKYHWGIVSNALP
jgi:hypothetical protein